MSFFKKYNGTMNKRLARLEKLIWVLIYGGLLSALVGWFMQAGGDAEGGWLVLVGAIAAVLGVILIVVRSRLSEGPKNTTARAPAPKHPTR
jgi:vacuolar-type H+-ATPase subunit I/STV1